MENVPPPKVVEIRDLVDLSSVIACASLAAGEEFPEPVPAYRRVDVGTP